MASASLTLEESHDSIILHAVPFAYAQHVKHNDTVMPSGRVIVSKSINWNDTAINMIPIIL